MVELKSQLVIGPCNRCGWPRCSDWLPKREPARAFIITTRANLNQRYFPLEARDSWNITDKLEISVRIGNFCLAVFCQLMSNPDNDINIPWLYIFQFNMWQVTMFPFFTTFIIPFCLSVLFYFFHLFCALCILCQSFLPVIYIKTYIFII